MLHFSPYKPGVAGSIPAPPTRSIAASRLAFAAADVREGGPYLRQRTAATGRAVPIAA